MILKSKSLGDAGASHFGLVVALANDKASQHEIQHLSNERAFCLRACPGGNCDLVRIDRDWIDSIQPTKSKACTWKSNENSIKRSIEVIKVNGWLQYYRLFVVDRHKSRVGVGSEIDDPNSLLVRDFGMVERRRVQLHPNIPQIPRSQIGDRQQGIIWLMQPFCVKRWLLWGLHFGNVLITLWSHTIGSFAVLALLSWVHKLRGQSSALRNKIGLDAAGWVSSWAQIVKLLINSALIACILPLAPLCSSSKAFKSVFFCCVSRDWVPFKRSVSE